MREMVISWSSIGLAQHLQRLPVELRQFIQKTARRYAPAKPRQGAAWCRRPQGQWRKWYGAVHEKGLVLTSGFPQARAGYRMIFEVSRILQRSYPAGWRANALPACFAGARRPMSNRLCPPAAVISTARRPLCWPLTSQIRLKQIRSSGPFSALCLTKALRRRFKKADEFVDMLNAVNLNAFNHRTPRSGSFFETKRRAYPPHSGNYRHGQNTVHLGRTSPARGKARRQRSSRQAA